MGKINGADGYWWLIQMLLYIAIRSIHNKLRKQVTSSIGDPLAVSEIVLVSEVNLNTCGMFTRVSPAFTAPPPSIQDTVACHEVS